jgi:hypothetical protein
MVLIGYEKLGARWRSSAPIGIGQHSSLFSRYLSSLRFTRCKALSMDLT